MLNSWIFDGEMIDKSFEFFIACDESSKQEKLWRSRYSLRHSMLPSFVSKELAQKVCVGIEVGLTMSHSQHSFSTCSLYVLISAQLMIFLLCLFCCRS